jgi:general secretion pathway protein D
MIEAVIVQVTLDKNMEFGVNFAALDGAGKLLGVAGNGAILNSAAGFTPASVLAGSAVNAATKGTSNSTTTGTSPPAIIDKTTSTSAISSTGKVSGGFAGNTTGFIQALEGFGETKVLACPRIMVLNKQRAEIHLGENMGYYTANVYQTSTNQTVNYLKVGTQLRLRPFVSSDGMIRLEVHPERSTGVFDSSGIPQTTSSQVTTNVMVPEGTTIVIGGLLDDEVIKEWEGLPLLSRLPWIGSLFRHTVETATRRELIVILTPHIWRPEAPAALNCLGRPRSLGLDARVSQRPRQEARDGASLYQLLAPAVCPDGDSPPNMPPPGP